MKADLAGNADLDKYKLRERLAKAVSALENSTEILRSVVKLDCFQGEDRLIISSQISINEIAIQEGNEE